MLICKMARRIHWAAALFLPESSWAPEQQPIEEKGQLYECSQQIWCEFEDYTWQVIILYYASVFNCL